MRASPLSRQVQIHKAIAHPARLRMLVMLRDGELCVCQITALLSLAASTVSAHLAELRRAGLVEERKNGRWVHYRLSATGAETLHALWSDLLADPQIQEDVRLLGILNTVTVEAVCRPDFNLANLAAQATKEGCCS